MKRSIIFPVLGACVGVAFGQNTNNLLGYKNGNPNQVSKYIHCTSFHVTKPLRELSDGTMKTGEYKKLDDEHENGKASDFHPNKSYPPDPLIQHKAGSIVLDTPLVNFEGGNYHYRPDATGAAGPNNYVQGVNTCNYNIYDKAGNLLLSTDMTILGGTCTDDPIVMYDKFADRWLVTDVSFSYGLTIAVSTTPDPTGSYYVYTYNFPTMPDFPKYSIWTDGYYATYRDIANDTVGVAVFERNKMLIGDPSAGIINSQFPNGHIVNPNSQLAGSPKILFCDGALPPFGTPEYLMYYTNVNMGDPTNSIMIYQLNTDTTNKTCTMTFVDSLATAPFNGYFAGRQFGGNIMEPGDSLSVWSLEGPFQYRVPYIKFTGYSSVVLCNTVNLGDSVGGIRWYELRQNDTTHKWSIHQQSTFGPNDGVSRWNGSICMDLNGDISLAYNVTNTTNLFPGIRYTGRLASDLPNQMTFAEQTAMRGTHLFNTQWGDYSESWLDPDGITFWHTNEYIIDSASTCDGCGTANVRIFSFRLTSSLAGVPAANNNAAEMKAYQVNNYLNVIASGLASNEKVVVNLFDINGKQLTSEWVNPQDNKVEAQINITGLAKGAYLVRIGNVNFQKVAKVVLQ